jgi:excisionase family DNA binding protein
MATINFNDLPEAVEALTEKVDKLYEVIANVQPQKQGKEFLTIEEAAEFLSLATPTLYAKVSKREIPYSKRGKRLYFARKDLENYLKEGRVKTIHEIEAETDRHLTLLKNGRRGR